MRLWSLCMIEDETLPVDQLRSQWRELIAIKRKIDKCSTPQHRLVNAVLDYNIIDFKNYTRAVYDAMVKRGFNVNVKLLNEIIMWKCNLFDNDRKACMYYDWLEGRWLETSIYNLQEKAIVGIVPYDEWIKIYNKYNYIFDNKLWKKGKEGYIDYSE